MSLEKALVGFFTSTVNLADCPADIPSGKIWWQKRDGYLYPWRIVSNGPNGAEGYPCGEPEKDD